MALVAGLLSCRQSYPSGGPHYFRSSAPRDIPIRPVGPLTPAEAARLRAAQPIVEATFDGSGRIVRCRQLHRERVLFTEEYSYRPTGILRQRQLVKEDGTRVTWSYDEDGMPFAREERGADGSTGG